MCLTCGCMDAHLEMGQHNITYEDIKAAAEENGKTVAETFEIFDETLERIAPITPTSTRPLPTPPRPSRLYEFDDPGSAFEFERGASRCLIHMDARRIGEYLLVVRVGAIEPAVPEHDAAGG